MLPGNALAELVDNDRVIGGVSPSCAREARRLYETFVEGECHLTDARTAEMVKLSENAFRDVNIAFANELSVVCDALGVDPWAMIRLANRHPRVDILQPGREYVLDNSACNLASLNLMRFIPPDGKPGEFDVETFRAAVRTLITGAGDHRRERQLPDSGDRGEQPRLPPASGLVTPTWARC